MNIKYSICFVAFSLVYCKKTIATKHKKQSKKKKVRIIIIMQMCLHNYLVCRVICHFLQTTHTVGRRLAGRVSCPSICR